MKKTDHTINKPSARHKVDWQAVERDYRTGKFTLRELEAKHGPHNGTIARRANREGWTQDLTDAVRQATKAALISDMVEECSKAQQNTAVTVLAAAELNKQVILAHREEIKRLRNVGSDLINALEQSALMASEQEAIAELLATVGQNGEIDPDRLFKLQQIVRKALELPIRIQALKALADTFTKLQGLERIAFGLDEKGGDDGGDSGKTLTYAERAVRLLHFLAKARQVQDVEVIEP